MRKKDAERVVAAVSAYADSRDERIAQLEGQLAKRSRPTEAQITYMVNRFLSWRLPEHFNPDGGISFDPIASKGTQHEFRRWPVGTNLLAATQADEMVRYMLEGLPSDESQ